MTKNLTRTAALCALSAGTLLSLCCTACRSNSMVGTYSDANGAVMLELKSGGKANLTFMGQVADCTYTAKSPHVNVNCNGGLGNVAFTTHDDGSLTFPPGSIMPRLVKEKK